MESSHGSSAVKGPAADCLGKPRAPLVIRTMVRKRSDRREDRIVDRMGKRRPNVYAGRFATGGEIRPRGMQVTPGRMDPHQNKRQTISCV
jgi:hypothetical protein